MDDVTFSASSSSDAIRPPIDAMFYNTRPPYEVDRMLRSFRREWRAFFAAFIAVMIIGALYIVLAPRLYSAVAIVMAAPRQADLSRTDSTASADGDPAQGTPREPDIEGEIEIITSPASLRRVVQQLHLDTVTPDASHASLSDLVKSLRVLLGVDQQNPADHPVSLQSLAHELLARVGIEAGIPSVMPPDPERLLDLAVKRLNRGLQVERVGRSTVVRIQYSGPEPVLTKNVAAALAQNYFDTRDRERTEAGANASSWLRQRAAELQNEVLESSARLAALRSDAITHGLDAEQLKDQIEVLSEQVVTAKVKEQETANQYSVAQNRVRVSGPVAILNWENSAGPNEYLAQERAISEMRKDAAQMAATRGPFNPNTTRLESEARTLEQELTIAGQTKLANLKLSVDAASGEVTALEGSLRSLRNDYDSLEKRSLTLKAFEQSATASRDVFRNFVSRWKMTEQVGFNEAQGWLISPPSVPTQPSKPNIPLILLGTLVAAVGAGSTSVLYRDYRRKHAVGSSEDVARHCSGINSTGLLPTPSGRHRRARDVVMATQSDAEFNEATTNLYVTLKAALERESHTAGGRIVVISSALPLEGKSSTAGVIALAGSAAGQRVIVVDCDLRVPTMHNVLQVELTSGLVGCIKSGMTTQEVIRKNHQTGVWVMPAGQIRKSPQSLLQSPRLAAIFAALREEFDLILIDTPPVLGLADARIVARLADRVLLAVTWYRTTGQAVKLALRTLLKSGVTAPIGVVLTRVNINRLAAYQVPEAEPYHGRNRRYYRHYYLQSGQSMGPD